MPEITIVDVTTEDAFGLLPLCADARFDHRTCDYWEDAVAGSKAHRPAWLRPREEPRREAGQPTAIGRREQTAPNPFAPDDHIPAPNAFAVGQSRPANPFAREPASGTENAFGPDPSPAPNPFAPASGSRRPSPFEALAREAASRDPFASLDAPDLFAPVGDNPFAPPPRRVEGPGPGAPRKLALLARGIGVFGSYARVLLVDGEPATYCQFGPLSAYPRALHLRELYPQLPASPLPAVITCIATTAEARHEGHALRLVHDVCHELARRGFAAVETYPEIGASENATSVAVPEFWGRAGFTVAVDDERFPVMRRQL